MLVQLIHIKIHVGFSIIEVSESVLIVYRINQGLFALSDEIIIRVKRKHTAPAMNIMRQLKTLSSSQVIDKQIHTQIFV